MTIAAYKATAEILSAYDDDKVGEVTGVIEIKRCAICGSTRVTAVFDGYAAQVADKTNHYDEIYALAIEATHRAVIETGHGGGIQIGSLYIGEEIDVAYDGIALDYLNWKFAA